MNTEAHFLDRVVGRAGGDLQAGAERQRTEWAMRRDSDVIGLGHGRDLAHLEDAARVAQVRLNDVDGPLLEERLELPSAVEPFTESDRCRGMRRDLWQTIHVLGEQRLFDEQ